MTESKENPKKMTRDDYKEMACSYFNRAFVERVNFPILLREAAIVLFLSEELNSSFALETKRRLEELNKTGVTD